MKIGDKVKVVGSVSGRAKRLGRIGKMELELVRN